MPQKLLAFFGQSKHTRMRAAVVLDLAIGNESLILQVLKILLRTAPIFVIAKAAQILGRNHPEFP
jgi:hypothetical protein